MSRPPFWKKERRVFYALSTECFIFESIPHTGYTPAANSLANAAGDHLRTAWMTMVAAHKEGIINGARLPMAFSIKFVNETPYTIFNVGCEEWKLMIRVTLKREKTQRRSKTGCGSFHLKELSRTTESTFRRCVSDRRSERKQRQCCRKKKPESK